MAITFHPIIWEEGDYVGLYDIYYEKTNQTGTPPASTPSIPIHLQGLAQGDYNQGGALNTAVNPPWLIARISKTGDYAGTTYKISDWYSYIHFGNTGPGEIDINGGVDLSSPYHGKVGVWTNAGDFSWIGWPTVSIIAVSLGNAYLNDLWDDPYDSLLENDPFYYTWQVGIPGEQVPAQWVLNSYTGGEFAMCGIRLDTISSNLNLGYKLTAQIYRIYLKFNTYSFGTVPAEYDLRKATITFTSKDPQIANCQLYICWDSINRVSLDTHQTPPYVFLIRTIITTTEVAGTYTSVFEISSNYLSVIEYCRSHSQSIHFQLRHSMDRLDYLIDFPDSAFDSYTWKHIGFVGIISANLSLKYGHTYPYVITNDATYVGTNNARLNGDLVWISPSISGKGFVYSLYSQSGDPVIGGPGVVQRSVSGLTGGTYYDDVSSLSSSTQYKYRSYGTDAIGSSYGALKTFTTGSTPILVPNVSNYNHANITSSGATIYGEVTNIGGSTCDDKGIVWSTSSTNPTVGAAGCNTISYGSGGLGTFSCAITTAPSATYIYYNTYAHNSDGYGYGSPYYFQTNAAVVPTITTSVANGIGPNNATLGGNITSSGGSTVTDRGVVWSASNNNPTVGGSGCTMDSNGFGIGSFSKNVTGLPSNSLIYFKACAYNSIGWGYGTVDDFNTLSDT